MRPSNQHAKNFVDALRSAQAPDHGIDLEDAMAIFRKFLDKDRSRDAQLGIVHTAAQILPVQVVFAEMMSCPAILDQDVETFFTNVFLAQVTNVEVVGNVVRGLYVHRRGALEIFYMKVCKLAHCPDVLDLLAQPVQTQAPS